MEKLNSTINSVTVYRDRAMIKRRADIKLAAGEHALIFDNLPISIEKNSIQVNANAELILQDIKFETKYVSELIDSDKKMLLTKKKNLLTEIKTIEDKIAILDKDAAFVDGIIKRTIKSEDKERIIELDIEKWAKILDFTKQRYEKIDTDKILLIKEKETKNEQLTATDFELTKYDKPELKINNQVVVKLQALIDTECQLQLSYIVYGPNWQPIYDLRVNTETKKTTIEYNALIKQKTGEDWTDVKLQLSTAQADISGTEPELKPWYLNFYVHTSVSYSMDRMEQAKVASGGFKKKAKMDMRIQDELEEAAFDATPILKPEAKVETGASSVVFVIPSKNSIYATGEAHKCTILVKDFDAEFKYSTVPKISQYAYLKAKIKNESEYPMLPGEAYVFLDGSFVAKSSLTLVVPEQEFNVSLGVDESMKVEYKFLKQYEKSEGVFNKKKKIIYEYNIIITNNKKSPYPIRVIDQIPISSHQDIVVELLEPKYKEDTNELKKDNTNKLTWEFKINSGEKKIIPLKFSIEYPQDQIIEGI